MQWPWLKIRKECSCLIGHFCCFALFCTLFCGGSVVVWSRRKWLKASHQATGILTDRFSLLFVNVVLCILYLLYYIHLLLIVNKARTIWICVLIPIGLWTICTVMVNKSSECIGSAERLLSYSHLLSPGLCL